MNNIVLDTDIEAVLSRLDRTNLEAMLRSLAAEFIRVNRAYSGLIARMAAVEVTATLHDRIAGENRETDFARYPQSLTIDAAFALSAESGFYHLEYDQSGKPYRWTGPEPTFWFEVFVDRRGAAELVLRYSQLYLQTPGQYVRCFVDGVEIDVETVPVDGEFEVRAVLPPRADAGGTVVSFVCPGVRSPGEMDYSGDTRKLGLAFRWLRVERTGPEVDLDEAKAPVETDDTELIFTSPARSGQNRSGGAAQNKGARASTRSA